MVDCSRVTDTILAQRGIGSVIKQSIPDEADDANEESHEVCGVGNKFLWKLKGRGFIKLRKSGIFNPEWNGTILTK